MMRRFLFIILSVISFLSAAADIIILKDGKTLNVYNVEVAKTNVFYTETADADADLKKVSISDVFAVKIGDGEMSTIGAAVEQPQPDHQKQTATTKTPAAKADSDNADLLSQYSAGDYCYDNKPSTDKDATTILAFYRLMPNSVLSTPELKVSIEVGTMKENKWLNFQATKKEYNYKFLKSLQYRFQLENKTDHPIYVDLSECARSGNVVPTKTFYDASQVTQGGSKSTGAGVAVLGIGIGGSSTKSNSLTKTRQEILMIPPHGRIYLPGDMRWSDYYKKALEENDSFTSFEIPDFADKLIGIKQLEKRVYTPEDAFAFINYMFTYSNDESFAEPKHIDFSFYIQQAIGAKTGALGVGFKDELSKIVGIDDKTIGGLIKFSENSKAKDR